MVKKLAFLLVAIVAIAAATGATVPIGMKTEWDAYWQGLTNKYRFNAGDLSLNSQAGFLIDTMLIPAGRMLDSFASAQGGYYNFIFTDSQAHGIALVPYKKWGISTIYLNGIDSTPILYPGYLGPSVAIRKMAADTPYTTSVTRLYWPYAPVER
jgi:hypothetical protein